MESVSEHFKRRMDRVLTRLNQTLEKIDGFKPLLDHHRSCAEFEIRANFDTLVDCLNRRRSSLLNQLNEVYQEKVSLIDSHKQNLDRIRSSLLTCLSTSCSNDPRVQELLSRAESDSDNYISDPFIFFRSEYAALPQAIANYGRVVSRYGGHFAVPGQPSSCLPLELEEEEDEPGECHRRCTVCTRVTPNCTCVKPDLQQWLVDRSHTCNRKHKYAYTSTGSSTHTSLASAQPQKCGYVFNNACAMVNTKQELSGYSTPGYADSGLNQCTAGAGCKSSLGVPQLPTQSDNLQDWLFCDPHMYLQDMPGLTKSLKLCSVRSQPCSDDGISKWLQPPSISGTGCSAAVSPYTNTIASATTSPAPLLPPHLTQGGPIDMNKWLKPKQPIPTESSENESQTSFVDIMTTESDAHEPVAPDYCIYAKCCGGPGGPTCCGARVKCARNETSTGMPPPPDLDMPATELSRLMLANCVPLDRLNTSKPFPSMQRILEIVKIHAELKCSNLPADQIAAKLRELLEEFPGVLTESDKPSSEHGAGLIPTDRPVVDPPQMLSDRSEESFELCPSLANYGQWLPN